MITDQLGKSNAVVNPPTAAGNARFMNVGRVNRSHLVLARPDASAQAPLLLAQKVLTQIPQPRLRPAQTLEQRDATDVSQVKLPCPKRGLFQRKSACHMNEDQAQPALRIG